MSYTIEQTMSDSGSVVMTRYAGERESITVSPPMLYEIHVDACTRLTVADLGVIRHMLTRIRTGVDR